MDTNLTKPPELIDIKAAAKILGVSTVRARQIVDGKPWCYRQWGRVLVERAALVKFQSTRQKTPGRPRLSTTAAATQETKN